MTFDIPDHLLDEIADRVADRLADRLTTPGQATPWMRTDEAIAYSRIHEGTFRKLAAEGRLRCHGGRSKLFHRDELDEDILGYQRSEIAAARLRAA